MVTCHFLLTLLMQYFHFYKRLCVYTWTNNINQWKTASVCCLQTDAKCCLVKCFHLHHIKKQQRGSSWPFRSLSTIKVNPVLRGWSTNSSFGSLFFSANASLRVLVFSVEEEEEAQNKAQGTILQLQPKDTCKWEDKDICLNWRSADQMFWSRFILKICR